MKIDDVRMDIVRLCDRLQAQGVLSFDSDNGEKRWAILLTSLEEFVRQEQEAAVNGLKQVIEDWEPRT